MNKHTSVRSLAVLLGSLTFAVQVSAQAPGAATATARHSLWKVAGTKNTVYLMGSVHALTKENYPLPAPLEAAYSNSQIVVFETDIAEMENAETQMKMLAKAQLPAGETLEGQLPAELYAQFKKKIVASGMPDMVFTQLKPSMAALMLVVLELQKMGLDTEQGLDKHFFKLARQQGKQIIPLETVDYQIGLVTDFTKEQGVALMRSTLKEIGKMKTELTDLLKAWETGDSAKLEKILNETVEEEKDLFKRLLTDRNHAWIPKLEELCHGEKNAVIIVGAGHLVGKEGVVELLKKKGLKVTQL